MKKEFVMLSLLSALVAGVGDAGAASVFFENFDTENGGAGAVNYSNFSKWAVPIGTVDLIGNGYWDFLPGNGLYVDLDGSTGTAGTLSSNPVQVSAGDYSFRFQLAGNQYTGNEQVTVKVPLANFQEIFTLAATQDFTSYSRMLHFDNDGYFNIVFSNSGGDYMGALLDDVSVTPVPEPGTMVMLGAGLLGLAVAGKRRKMAQL